jgi:hypothetical protein
MVLAAEAYIDQKNPTKRPVIHCSTGSIAGCGKYLLMPFGQDKSNDWRFGGGLNLRP